MLYAALLSLGFGISPVVEVFACAVGLLALMVIGAGGGALLGMRWPHPALASATAGVAVGGASLAGVGALLGSALTGLNRPVSEMFAVAGLCGALPLLLAWLAVSGALQRPA